MDKSSLPNSGLQRYDGRVLDIREDGTSLTLHSTSSAWMWGRLNSPSMRGLILFAAIWTLATFQLFSIGYPVPFLLWLYRAIVLLVLLGCVERIGLEVLKKTAWQFDRDGENLTLRTEEGSTVSLASLRALRGWQRGKARRRKFFLALDFQNGESMMVGGGHYATSEASWRHDAAQIAAFLQVPLEIPAV